MAVMEDKKKENARIRERGGQEKRKWKDKGERGTRKKKEGERGREGKREGG